MMSDNKQTTSEPLTSLRDRLAVRLDSVRRLLWGHFVLEGVARTLVVMVALLLLSLGLDWWLDLSLTARLIYWIVVLTASGIVFFRFVIRPCRLPWGPIDVAAALDQKLSDQKQSGPRLASQVATVIQLAETHEHQAGESEAMRDMAVRVSHLSLEKIDFRSLLDTHHLWKYALIVVGTLLVPTGVALAFPGTARLWMDRWFAGSDRPWPRATHLEVLGVRDGVLQVPRGEPFRLQVKVTDQKQPTQTVSVRQKPHSGPALNLTMERFADGDFRLELPPQQHPSRLDVWGGDGRAEPFRMEPVDRPRIVSMTLRAKGPRDVEPQVFDFQASDGSVRLSPQTAAHFEFETNVECKTVHVESNSPLISSFEKQTATRHAVDWVHQESVSLRIVLVSSESGLESHPQTITIGELPDRPPRMSMRHSGVRLRITPDATIPLTMGARDDFGVSQVKLSFSSPTGHLPKVSSADETPSGDPAHDASASPTPSTPATTEGGVDAAKDVAASSDTSTQTPAESNDPAASDASTDTADASPAPTEPSDTSAPLAHDTIIYGPVSPTIEIEVDREHNVEVATWKLDPGRTLVLTGSVDDDCVQGTQTTRTAPLVFRIVKHEELFREILLKQQQLRSRLQKTRDQADVMITQIPFAVSADEARKLARQHQLTIREVSQVSQGIEATLTEMKLNKLGGEEAWALIANIIIQPLRTLSETELPAQRESLDSLISHPGDGLEEITAQQKKIVEDLDRILKNMSQWDSFIDIVNQVDAVIKLESRVRQQTEELKKQSEAQKKKETDSIFDE